MANLTSTTITGNANVTAEVNAATFAGDAGKTSNLAAGNIASGTLSTDRLPTVPTTKGGTGLTSIGSAGQVLKVSSPGSALEFGDAGGGGDLTQQVFNSPGTYTKPTGLAAVKVTVYSGGGGGGGGGATGGSNNSQQGGSGGTSGYSMEVIPAASIPGPVSVTVGSGGAGGTPGPFPDTNARGNPGSTGGTSSFGAFLSVTGGGGGEGGLGGFASDPGTPGSGSGGDVNFSGFPDMSFGGTSQPGNAGNNNQNANSGTGIGAGGGGGWITDIQSRNGATGTSGLVIVESIF